MPWSEVEIDRRSELDQVIALCGVSGGCGGTTLALNLAAEFVSSGRSCLLVELARQAGTLASNLAIEPDRTVADLLADPSQLNPTGVRRVLTSIQPGLDVLVAPYQEIDPTLTAFGGRISWRNVIPLIAVCRRLAPLLILDVPCTFDDLLFETLSLADRVMLVGVQAVSSIRTMKMLRETAEREEGVQRPLLVINRYDPHVPGFDAARLAELLEVDRVWTVADDYPSVMTALYHGQPIRQAVPHSRILPDIAALVEALTAPPEGTETDSLAVFVPEEPEAPAGPRRVRVLHVEDDLLQQMELTFLLGGISDMIFDITPVTSESAAIETFSSGMAESDQKSAVDVVLLDYHLAQGNGLSCLRRLRQIDPLVPIIVISSVADPHIAAELLEAGVDDFVSKGNLSTQRLARGLHAAIARVSACRQRLSPGGGIEEQPARTFRADGLFEQVQHAVAAGTESELQSSLRELQLHDWPIGLPVARIQRLVDLVGQELGLSPEKQPPVTTALLALFLRLFGEIANEGPAGNSDQGG